MSSSSQVGAKGSSDHAQAPKNGHLPHLDGLRGLAALVVVISHAANADLLPRVLGQGFGQMGVTLFYALSAFLLGHLYFTRAATRPALRAYAASRIARVIPLYFAVLAICGIVWLVFGRTFYTIDTIEEFAFNVALIQGSSVLWSIPVELQFYLVFALMWFLSSQRDYKFWQLIVGAFFFQAMVAVPLYVFAPQAGQLNLAFWAHLFLAGLVLSQMQHPVLTRKLVWLQALGLVSLVVFGLPEMRRQLGLPVLPNFADPLTAGVPLLLLVLALRRAAPLEFLAHPFLRWLGGISFGLYLLHMPVLEVLTEQDFATDAPLLAFLMLLGVSVSLAWLAQISIERPAQSWLRPRLERKRVSATTHSFSAQTSTNEP